MSYIVGRLIQVLTEEEAFWVFTIILENYLPLDYMADLTGAVIDQKVFEHIVNYRYPEILKKLDDMMLQPGLTTMSGRSIFHNCVIVWFQSLFTYNMPEETAWAFLDLFLLRGRDSIFFVGLALVNMLKKQILECKSIDQLQNKILKGTHNKTFGAHGKLLSKSQKYKIISTYEIQKFRDFYQKITNEQINSELDL